MRNDILHRLAQQMCGTHEDAAEDDLLRIEQIDEDRQRLTEVWNEVSGAAMYTLDVRYEKGVLYCTIGSSMVRNQLYFQRDVLAEAVNEALKKDELFTWDWSKGPCVKSLVLR